MALKHHVDDRARFEQQVDNSRDFVLPFIERTLAIGDSTRVLEIGCGEGGVLKPFAEKGAYCLGVDMDSLRIDLANGFLKEEVAAERWLSCSRMFTTLTSSRPTVAPSI
jgi:2-polyprenyl-3-methyl-5-hydroxy-6-metoxy-1,4-benzoquinol methylase